MREPERNEIATMYTTIEDMYYERSRLDARTRWNEIRGGRYSMVENEALRTNRGPISVGCTGKVDTMGALSNRIMKREDKSHPLMMRFEMTCCPPERHSGGRT